MKSLSILLFLAVCAQAFAYESKGPKRPSYIIDTTFVNPKLDDDEALFLFTISGEDLNLRGTIVYSIDEKIDTLKMKRNGQFKVKTSSGIHKFQFFVDEEHHEIFINSIEIKPQHQTNIRLRFSSSARNINVKKPVIYLYPKGKTNISVHVEPAGELTFTYPTYSDGWNVSAEPDGTLTIQNKKYNYLFWEANQVLGPDLFDPKKGFAISSNNITQFLEESLSKYGFTSKEMADFITFWAPLMIRHEACSIHFVMNEDCAQIAELNITPKPENIYRFYMFWSPIENLNDFDYLCPQEIQPINRLGFIVLEWGGAEINNSQDEVINAEL